MFKTISAEIVEAFKTKTVLSYWLGMFVGGILANGLALGPFIVLLIGLIVAFHFIEKYGK